MHSIDPDYQDVAEVFYSDPGGWLQSYYHTAPTAPPIPSHLVMYDVLTPVSFWMKIITKGTLPPIKGN